MPINYEQLRPQILNMGELLSARRAAEKEQLRAAADIFGKFASTEDLPDRMQEILLSHPNERCAIPGTDPIAACFPEPAAETGMLRLLACDGSQIIPNRHEEVAFALLNTSVFEYVMNSGLTPVIDTRTELLPDEKEENNESLISVKRDAAEKRRLAERAEEITDEIPTLAICDGPVELFMDTPDLKGQDRLKADYRESLSRIAETGIPIAGYIDRPRSNPVMQMLALLEQNSGTDADTAFGDLPDSLIFEIILGSGKRSAVFGMNSRFNHEMQDRQKLCFFYLNVGKKDSPYLCRVEFPQWVAENTGTLDRLHGALLAQCRILPDHPYPYVLHRAHESAVVTFAERDQIRDLILKEMLRRGMVPMEKSNKQIAKDLSGIN